MKKVIGLVIGLLPVSAFGECVPVPECASIGYTETSCDGGSLKCPFDTTKLLCVPCDSSFRYSCSGENIKNPIGVACNNKYVACECADRTTFVNGECVCDTSCDTIGNIVYSDYTCSSCNLTDKTPVGIVAYKNENKRLIMSIHQISSTWSANQQDEEGNVILHQHLDLSELPNLTKDLAQQDYTGFDNTQIIVEAYGENATGVAAVYCYNYTPEGLEETKGKWYLPATAELYDIIFNNKAAINNALNTINANALTHGYLWASAEYTSKVAWGVHCINIGIGSLYKHTAYDVRCLLEW